MIVVDPSAEHEAGVVVNVGVAGVALTVNVAVSSCGQLLFAVVTSTRYTFPDIAVVTLLTVKAAVAVPLYGATSVNGVVLGTKYHL